MRTSDTPEADHTPQETMAVVAARLLHEGQVCFVGIGLPSLAANLARHTHAPGLVLVYESGTIGSKPHRLPLSIGDGDLAETADTVVSVPEIFAYWVQAGRIDVAFLGAAQIDRFGNLNSTVIGDYNEPVTRLPGSGGACEIAINARQVFVIMRQSKRSFVERIDFRTSPGNLGGAEQSERIRKEQGWLGRGPSVVVTDLAVWHFGDDGEMRVDSLHPGVTLDAVRAATGWEPKVPAALAETSAPTPDELRLIREELDPGGAYTR